MSLDSPVMDARRNDTDFQPKLIYLARRNPALSRSEFVARWRRHGALGMSLPRWRNIARYAHCDVLHPQDATGLLADQYDGVGIVWHRSPSARRAHLADRSSREQMERDELETFAEPVVNFCLVAREIVLLAPDVVRESAVKLIRFIRAHDRAQAESIASMQRQGGAVLREKLRAMGAEPCGHVINEPLPPEQGDRWGLDVDCIEELWFGHVDAALTAVRALAGSARPTQETQSGEPAAITVLTNEVVLYET